MNISRSFHQVTIIDRAKLHTLQKREESRFLADHPKSAALYQRAQSSLLGGVPMNWMKKSAGAFPVFFKSPNAPHFPSSDCAPPSRLDHPCRAQVPTPHTSYHPTHTSPIAAPPPPHPPSPPSASSPPTTATGAPPANPPAVTVHSSSPTKLTPFALVPAAAPPNG